MKNLNIEMSPEGGGSDDSNRGSRAKEIRKTDTSPNGGAHEVREKTNFLKGVVNMAGDGLSDEELLHEEQRVREQAACEEEIQTLSEELEDTEDERDQHEQIDKGNDRLVPKWKIMFCAPIALLCSIMMALHSGRFVLDVTQSFVMALLFTAIFPAATFGLEAIASRFASIRTFIDGLMGLLFVGSFLVFLVTFANNFAFLPDLGSLEALTGGVDYRATVVSQILLEMSIVFALLGKIKQWFEEISWLVINPYWKIANDEVQAIKARISELKEKLNASFSASAAFAIRKDREEARSRVAERFFKS